MHRIGSLTKQFTAAAVMLLVERGALSMTSPFAAGALGSTLTDLLAWETALTTGRLISRESFRAMATPATLNDGTRTAYGYGVTIDR